METKERENYSRTSVEEDIINDYGIDCKGMSIEDYVKGLSVRERVLLLAEWYRSGIMGDAEVCRECGLRPDKWSKIKNGSIWHQEDVEYPLRSLEETLLRERIAYMLIDGVPMSRIAREVGIPYSKVRRLKEEGVMDTVERVVPAFAKLRMEGAEGVGGSAPTPDEPLPIMWFAYHEVRGEWEHNQRTLEAIYRARRIPSQRLPFPLSEQEALGLEVVPDIGWTDAKKRIEQEVAEWMQRNVG